MSQSVGPGAFDKVSLEDSFGNPINPATEDKQDDIITELQSTQGKFPFEDYQYMGTDSTSSATYKYVAFKHYTGVGFYCMRIHQTNANDVAYYYNTTGTGTDFDTFWADPSDAGYTYGKPPDS